MHSKGGKADFFFDFFDFLRLKSVGFRLEKSRKKIRKIENIKKSDFSCFPLDAFHYT